jgi:hypothetical protein
MGVLVCYDDFTYDVVNDCHLEYLMGKGCIIGYDNSGEWVKLEAPLPGNADPLQATLRVGHCGKGDNRRL